MRDMESKRVYDRAYRETHRKERSAYARAYRETHHDKIATYGHVWHVEHRESRREEIHTRTCTPTYREAHREHRTAYMRIYRESHREECNANTYAWQKAHQRQRTEQGQRRQARKHGATIGLVDLAAIKQRDRMLCCICGEKVAERDFSLDHTIPLSLGGPHSQENLRVAHVRCNSRRGAGRLPVQMVMAL